QFRLRNSRGAITGAPTHLRILANSSERTRATGGSRLARIARRDFSSERLQPSTNIDCQCVWPVPVPDEARGFRVVRAYARCSAQLRPPRDLPAWRCRDPAIGRGTDAPPEDLAHFLIGQPRRAARRVETSTRAATPRGPQVRTAAETD